MDEIKMDRLTEVFQQLAELEISLIAADTKNMDLKLEVIQRQFELDFLIKSARKNLLTALSHLNRHTEDYRK